MYDNDDVIRKKIISNFSSLKETNVFAFSSWFYLILILWLFSDHIQMGIRRNVDERWKRRRKRVKFIWNYSWSSFPQWCFQCRIKASMSTQSHYVSRINFFLSYESGDVLIDMHRNWKIINFVWEFSILICIFDVVVLMRLLFSPSACCFSFLSNVFLSIYFEYEARSKTLINR